MIDLIKNPSVEKRCTILATTSFTRRVKRDTFWSQKPFWGSLSLSRRHSRRVRWTCYIFLSWFGDAVCMLLLPSTSFSFLFFSRDRIDPLFKMAESAALPRWRSWTIPSGEPALLTQIKTAPPFTCHAIGSSSWLVARERGIHAGVYMFGSEACVLYPAHYR